MAKETDNFIKSSFGWLELVNYTNSPIDTDANRRGLAFVGGALKYWNGSSWVSISGSGGVSTLDELYDNDKVLLADDGTLTFVLPAAETADLLTLQAQATATGDCLQFINAGTGYDVVGTSSTWSFSKAGDLLVASIAGSATDTALTIDANGSGKITIAGTSTGVIEFQASMTSAASKSLTMAGVGGSNILVITAGDALMSDGSLTIVDADNATSLSLTNNTITTAGLIAITSTSLTTGNGLLMTCNGLTGGNMISLVTTAAGLTTGKFLSINDGSARFTIGADGATAITTGVNSTKALEITGIQTSEQLVTITSSGVTADNKAILLINSSGASASGSNQIRIAPSGSPVEGSVGIEFVGSAKLMQAMNIDGDSVDNSVVLINGGGALASDKAVLEVTNDGNLASGGNLARFAIGGTPNAAAIGIEVVGAGKALTALSVDADPTASNVVLINGGGALTDGLAVLGLTNDGNLATGGSILHVTMGGTPHAAANAVEITAAKDAQALVITSSAATNDAVSISSAGATATGKAALYVTSSGTPAAAASNVVHFTFTGTATNNPVVLNVNNGTANACPLLVTSNVAAATRQVARFVQDSTTGAIEVLDLQQDDADVGVLKLTVGAPNTGDLTVTTDDKSGGTPAYIKIKINSTNYWIKATPAA
ncbi:MAG: hypothetical protein WC451_04965 [Patescibacteria group bacterium]